MKFYKVGTEARVTINTPQGDRVKHGIVTEVIDQDHLNVRVGRVPYFVRRDTKFFYSPNAYANGVVTPHGTAAGTT